ncbi:MAG TPA: MFS transporter [Gemmatimonadaceae bacterium]|nr:MFS transporter [Gemmatimonadaceae bacterium]
MGDAGPQDASASVPGLSIPLPPSPIPSSPTLLSHVRALTPAAWALLIGTFVNRFGSFVIAFLVLYVAQRGYSATQAGAALSLYGIGSILAALAGGHVADHFGRRNAIAASMFASAAVMLLLSRAESLPAILALSGLAGFAAELYRPASSALVADLTPAGERVTAFALYRLAVNAGTSIGPAVAGLLAQRSFTWLFVGDAITSVAYGVVALSAFPGGRPAAHEVSGTARAVRTMLADRAFARVIAASLAIALIFQQAYSTLPLHLRAAGYTPSVYGLLMGLNGALIITLELAVISYTRRLPTRPVLAAGLLLAGAGFGLVGVAHGLPLLALAIVVWTFGEMTFAPVSAAHVADLAPADMRARYQGVYSFTFAFGLAAAPLLGTALYSLSPNAVWFACLALGAAGAIIMLRPIGVRDAPAGFVGDGA